MKKIIRWFVPKREREITMSRALLESITNQKPGGVNLLKDEDGNEFVVMNRDDFEHIAGLAGLGIKAPPDSAQAEPK